MKDSNIEAVSSILNILREYSESNPNATLMNILTQHSLVVWSNRNETSQETLKRIVGIESGLS